VELKRESELLRALHDEHAHSLLSYVVALTNSDRSRAQDVVQATLLRAWRNPAVLERTGGSGRGWLFTVARRIVIDQWRSASRRPEVLTDHVPEHAVEGTAQQTVDRQLVRAVLQTLSIETPAGAVRVLLPRRINRRGRRYPRRATRHRQVPHPLRAPRATTGNRRDGRRCVTTPDPPEQHDAAKVLGALSGPKREASGAGRNPRSGTW
jgi:hypothetical protein